MIDFRAHLDILSDSSSQKKGVDMNITLHDHLDGSRAILPVLKDLFEMSGKKYPFQGSPAEQHEAVKRVFDDPQVNIVEKFSNTTGVMQSKDTLALAAESYTRERQKSGFRYCEATIAPQYHVFGGLRVQEVVEALIEGIKRGEAACEEKIEVNLIFTIGREIDPQDAVRLVEAAAECDRRYVVGIGLACDEAAHPPEKHKPMFARAKELNFGTTCHAGEWARVRPDYWRDEKALLKNIRTAVFDLGVDRVGHAIPLAYDPKLVAHMVKYMVAVEGCPGSNLSTKLIPNVAYLRIRELLDTGVLYSLNQDDDLFMPDLAETFTLCDAEYRFTNEEKAKLENNAWLTRFGERRKYPAR